MKVLTVVSATVSADRATELVERFDELLKSPTPDGLLRTELVRGDDDEWRIQTLWRDREALAAMRAAADPPAAPALFRSVGAEPSLAIFAVEREHPTD